MRVLFADKDVLFLEMLQRYFDRYGYMTEVAATGLECLAALRGFQPDVLVLDHALNGDVNAQNARQMNQTANASETPVVLIGDRLDDFSFSGQPSVIAYFRKPFLLHDLLEAIATAKPRAEPGELLLGAG